MTRIAKYGAAIVIDGAVFVVFLAAVLILLAAIPFVAGAAMLAQSPAPLMFLHGIFTDMGDDLRRIGTWTESLKGRSA